MYKGKCIVPATVDEDSHHRLVEWMKTAKVEYGGTMRFYSKDQKLYIDRYVRGSFSSVDIPRSQFNYHTHPATCTDKYCTIPVPSPQDVYSIAKTFEGLDGTIAHFLYTEIGVYVFLVHENFGISQRRLKQLYHRLEKMYKNYSEKENDLIFQKFCDVLEDYEIELAKFPLNTPPQINIVCQIMSSSAYEVARYQQKRDWWSQPPGKMQLTRIRGAKQQPVKKEKKKPHKLEKEVQFG